MKLSRKPNLSPRACFVDSFSGPLADLPKGQRTVHGALLTLRDSPRVSTFDRGPQWLESLIAELLSQGLAIEDKAEPYPWHRFHLTDAGRQMLADCKPPNVGIEARP